MGSCLLVANQNLAPRPQIYIQSQNAATIEQELKTAPDHLLPSKPQKQELQCPSITITGAQTIYTTSTSMEKSRFYQQHQSKKNLQQSAKTTSFTREKPSSSKNKKKSNQKKNILYPSIDGEDSNIKTEPITSNSLQVSKKIKSCLILKRNRISNSSTNTTDSLAQSSLKTQEQDIQQLPRSQKSNSHQLYSHPLPSPIPIHSTPTPNAQVKICHQVTYNGHWKAGRPHGQGRLQYPEGVYNGQWVEGQMHGQGCLLFTNGDCYQGTWHRHTAHGNGCLRLVTGWTYKGDWKTNQPHGQGVEQWSAREYYSGQWDKGRKEGQGQLLFADGSYYKGHFHHNELHGKGDYYWHNRQTYSGHWQHNLKDGWGKLKVEGSYTYEGMFKADKRHGKGTLITQEGKSWIGTWYQGKKNGVFKECYQGQCKTALWSYGKHKQDLDNGNSHSLFSISEEDKEEGQAIENEGQAGSGSERKVIGDEGLMIRDKDHGIMQQGKLKTSQPIRQNKPTNNIEVRKGIKQVRIGA